MSGFGSLTLYDLMAEDFDIWVKKNDKFGFDVQIDDENGKTVVEEQEVHPFAMDSYADLCRQFLRFYEKSKAA